MSARGGRMGKVCAWMIFGAEVVTLVALATRCGGPEPVVPARRVTVTGVQRDSVWTVLEDTVTLYSRDGWMKKQVFARRGAYGAARWGHGVDGSGNAFYSFPRDVVRAPGDTVVEVVTYRGDAFSVRVAQRMGWYHWSRTKGE